MTGSKQQVLINTEYRRQFVSIFMAFTQHFPF